MKLAEILPIDRVECGVRASSKKRTLEAVSELIAHSEPSLSSRGIFDSFCARERLGSTGLGEGVALPHARIEGLSRTIAAFLRLEDAIDYDSPDGKPVDLVLGLLVPEESTEQHLEILATIAERLSSEALREALRESAAPANALEVLTGEQQTV